MGKKEKTRFLIVWLVITLVFLVGSFVVPSPEKTETVKVMMRDAVLMRRTDAASSDSRMFPRR